MISSPPAPCLLAPAALAARWLPSEGFCPCCFFFLEYTSPDMGRAHSLQLCAQRPPAQRALPCPPPPCTFYPPSLDFSPQTHDHLTFCVLYTFRFLSLVFPHSTAAPWRSRFWLFLFSTVFLVSRVGPGTQLVLSTYFWMNEWNSVFCIQEEMEGGWSGGERRKEANPDSLHTWSLKIQQWLLKKRTFSTTEERE